MKDTRVLGRRLVLGMAALAALMLGCVDALSGPDSQPPANVRVAVTLPPGTPGIWSPVGETLHVSVRRAGRAEPIVDTTLRIVQALEASIVVPLAYSVERFVVSAELRYGGLLLFLGFDAAQLRAGQDTSLTLAATYVGPGARTMTFELAARDTTLSAPDTARLIRVARDTAGLMIPNVPARFLTERPALVGVDTAGLLTAQPGSATGTARVQAWLPTGHASELNVSVVDTVVATVVVIPTSATLTALGAQEQYTATAYNAAGEPVPAALTWESGNLSVATIDANGVATATGKGTTQITARAGARSGTATIIVDPPDTTVASITVEPTADTLRAAGEKAQYTATARNAAGQPVNASFTWSTGNGAVATVDQNGQVTATGNGSTPVTATVDTVSGSATVVVEIPDNTVASITVTPPTATLTTIGATAQYTATARNAAGQPVSASFVWSSGNMAVATVDQTGLATAAGNGTTLISATSGGVTGSATIEVAAAAHPRVRTWVGGDPAGPSDWGRGANWSPAGVPTAGDTVIIGNTDNNPMLTGPVTIARLRILDDTLWINGQQLTVTGDLLTENGTGMFAMMNAADTVRILGNARLNGGDPAGLVTEGALFLSGNFEYLEHPTNTRPFYAEGNHRTVFNGSSQQTLRDSSISNLDFGHLDIVNGGGLRGDIDDELEVKGTLRITTPVALDVDTANLDVRGSIVTAAGSAIRARTAQFAGPMAIGGGFSIDSVEFRGPGMTIQPGLPYRFVLVTESAVLGGATNVSGVLVISEDGELAVAGHKLTVDSLDVGGDGVREGRLIMQQPADSLIAGAAMFHGDTIPGLLTAGTMIISRDFGALTPKSFLASGTHRTILNGSAGQRLVLYQDNWFQHLEVVNPVGPLTIPATNEITWLNVSGKLAIRTPIAVSGATVEAEVGDSLVTVAGGTLELEELKLRDRFIIAATPTIRTIEFAGVGQDIPANIDYQNIRVRGSARFTGRTTMTGYLEVYGDEADLALNGNRVFVGDAFRIDVNGKLRMTNPADSLIVTLDANFAGASTDGLLTAGTLILKLGLFSFNTPDAFQPSGSHRTIMDGSDFQFVHFETADPTGSRFNHLELGNTASGFWYFSPIHVAGTLTTRAPGQSIRGSFHYLLTAESVDVSQLTLDSVSMKIGSGAISRFDSVTFVRQNRAGAQLEVTHPGAASPFRFTRTRFLTAPTTGTYVTATDAAPGDGNVLTIDLSQSTPTDGSAQTVTAGGAVVQWTGSSAAFSALSANQSFSCGLDTDGKAFCWGVNDNGQLGNGTLDNSNTPTAVSTGFSFTQIVTGGQHACALNDGDVYCWGSNLYGQLGDGTTTTSITPVKVSGTLQFTAIAAGEQYTCGLIATGALYCWGRNWAGQLGDGTTTDRSVPTLVSTTQAFSVVSAKFSYTCALTAAGAAYCWGHNSNGKLGDGTTTDRLTPTAVSGSLAFANISAGAEHTCAVTTSGVAYCWGWNNFGQLGDGTTTTRTSPTAVSGGLTFATISAGGNGYSCGVTTSGAAYCWGVNGSGQLGNGTTGTTPATAPTAVSGGLTFAALDAGFAHVVALSTGNSGYAWGHNLQGQLGDGSNTRQTTPVLIIPPSP